MGPRYRFRYRIRRRLPTALISLGLAAKGKQDCGDHNWYNADNQDELCYYCEPGTRPYDAAHFVGHQPKR